MAGERLESLYYELDLVTQGMDAGRAKAEAALKSIDKAVAGTQRNIDGISRRLRQSGNDVARAVTPDPVAIKRAVQQGEDAAREMTRRIKRTFDLAQAETRESLIRGLITPAQARQQGQLAARAYNEAVLRTIEKAGDAGQLKGLRGETTLIALTRQLKDADTAGVKFATGLRGIQAPLTTLTTQAIGAKAGVGRLVSQLGLLGVGAGPLLAITVGIGAIVTAFNKLRQGAREAKTETQAAIERLRELARQRGLGVFGQTGEDVKSTTTEAARIQREIARRQDLLAATPLTSPSRAGRESKIKELQQQYSDLIRIIRAGEAEILEVQREAADREDEQSQRANDKREREQDRAERAAAAMAQRQAASREAFAAAIAAQTTGKADNLETVIDNLTREAVAAGRGAREIAQEVAELRAASAERLAGESKALADDMRRQLAGLTLTQLDDLTLSIGKFKETVQAARDAGQTVDESLFARVLGSMEEARALTAEAENLEAALQRIERVSGMGANFIQSMRELQGRLAGAEADERGATTPEARAAAQDRIRKITAQIAVLQDRVADANERTAAAAADVESRTQRIASGVADAANAAFGLASAMLGVNSSVTRALGSIGQMAGGIESVMKLASTKDANGKAPGLLGLLSSGKGLLSALPGIGQAIGGAMALAGSLFGKDPAIAAARKETVEALNRLRGAVLDLRESYLRNVSSAQAALDLALVERGAGLGANGTIGGQRILRPGEGHGPGRRDNLRAIARALGLDFDDGTFQKRFAELDQRYGTNLSSFIQNENPQGFLEALRQMPEALREAIARLGGFANDAAGVLERINLQMDLLGQNDPAARFRAIVQALKESGVSLGEFQDELERLADETLSAEAREELIRELTARLTGGGTLDLGGLTAEQLQQLVRQGIGATRGTGTGGFNVDRSITEVTGSRIGAMLSTANIWHQKTAENTEIIARILALANGVSPVIPPPLPRHREPGSGECNVYITIEKIEVALPAGTTDDPTMIGRRLSESLIDEIDRRLGQRMRMRQHSRGISNVG